MSFFGFGDFRNRAYYVEPVKENNNEVKTTLISQPINRVPIDLNQNTNGTYNNQQYQNQNYNQPYNNQQYNNQNYQQPPVVVVQQNPAEGCAFAVLSLIFGLLGGWLGLLFGIIGLCKYKETGNRTMCVIGIIAWVIWVVVLIVIYANYYRYFY